jgi:hypothetical protein
MLYSSLLYRLENGALDNFNAKVFQRSRQIISFNSQSNSYKISIASFLYLHINERKFYNL